MPKGLRTRGLAATLALGLAAVIGSCTEPRETKAPNVLLITLDTTRRDHASAYGYERATTPTLSALAAAGARFDAAYSPTSTTGPTHASLFTSLYPIRHRIIKNGLRLSDEVETLAERLAARGYRTAGIVSSFVLDARFGYAQGFQHYADAFDLAGSTVKSRHWEGHTVAEGFDRRADRTTDRAIRWLQADGDDAPFFLFVHYFDAHDPYVPPEPWASRFAAASDATPLEQTIAAYDAEIAFVDHEVGRLLEALDALGETDGTIVVVTADHGEGLMQHGHPLHGAQIYEEQVRVPLVVRWPGHVAPRVFEAPVEMVDLAPTLLELVGAPAAEPSHQGTSLAAALLGEEAIDPRRPVFLHRRHYDGSWHGGRWVEGEQFGIRRDDWKLILGEQEGTRELFDLASDPGERVNVYETAPRQAEALSEILDRWRSASARAPESAGEVSEADRERLRALGYVD